MSKSKKADKPRPTVAPNPGGLPVRDPDFTGSEVGDWLHRERLNRAVEGQRYRQETEE